MFANEFLPHAFFRPNFLDIFAFSSFMHICGMVVRYTLYSIARDLSINFHAVRFFFISFYSRARACTVLILFFFYYCVFIVVVGPVCFFFVRFFRFIWVYSVGWLAGYNRIYIYPLFILQPSLNDFLAFKIRKWIRVVCVRFCASGIPLICTTRSRLLLFFIYIYTQRIVYYATINEIRPYTHKHRA